MVNSNITVQTGDSKMVTSNNARVTSKRRKRRRSKVNDQKRFRDKRGTGEFEEYVPWIWATDFSPHSMKFRIPGIKIKRLHHVLSMLEARVFYILESMPDVIDIREQFPLLPIIETISIAADLGIKHPKLDGTPLVRTTDFLVVTNKSTTAYSVKYRRNLTPRNLELIAIEREYWKRRTIEFVVILDTSITRPQYKNAKRIRSFSQRPNCKISDDQLIKSLAECVDPDRNTRAALRMIANKFGESMYNVHHLFLHLLNRNLIKLDFRKTFAIDTKTTDLCFQNQIYH